jgi:ribosomal-protein-alanine N-acetyltransferase
MTALETDRLILRRLTLDDADFILRLVNDPSWLRYIGDRGVRTVEDACAYLRKGPIAMYEIFGFGLYAAQRKLDGAVIGLCGLIKRNFLKDFDLGFALLPEYRGQGYAREATTAVLNHARVDCDLLRVAAITSLDNERSIRLLESLGFEFEEVIRISDDDPGTRLFARVL